MVFVEQPLKLFSLKSTFHQFLWLPHMPVGCFSCRLLGASQTDNNDWTLNRPALAELWKFDRTINNLVAVRLFLLYFDELSQELFPQADTENKQDEGYRIHPAHCTLISSMHMIQDELQQYPAPGNACNCQVNGAHMKYVLQGRDGFTVLY